MKIMKRLSVLPLLVSLPAFAHPGHDGLTSVVHPSKHLFSGMESTLIYTGLALLAAAAVWLVNRR